jgi:hypothetical protein
MILYLVIRCGYEGIDELVFPTLDAKEASEKVLEIRKKIVELQKRRIEVLERFGKCDDGQYKVDELFQDAWDRMGLPQKEGGTREITSEEWYMGRYANPDAYCVRKWDGSKFECVCQELKVEPSEHWVW